MGIRKISKAEAKEKARARVADSEFKTVKLKARVDSLSDFLSEDFTGYRFVSHRVANTAQLHHIGDFYLLGDEDAVETFLAQKLVNLLNSKEGLNAYTYIGDTGQRTFFFHCSGLVEEQIDGYLTASLETPDLPGYTNYGIGFHIDRVHKTFVLKTVLTARHLAKYKYLFEGTNKRRLSSLGVSSSL